ncbi:MAG: mannose-6-phosphate isomerase, class I [Fidelibacterota bacterium]
MDRNDFKTKPYRLNNEIQTYAWGQCGEKAFIPKLLGLKPEPGTAYAELWIGAHPKAPSKVDDTSLPEFIRRYPKEILGSDKARKFDNQLPFLLKVLSAGEALSIQAHPNKSQAEELHRLDPEHYPDDNHKPEIAIALTKLTALVGFKKIKAIKQILNDYPPIHAFISADAHTTISATRNDREWIRLLYSEIMNKAEEKETELEKVLQDMDLFLKNKEDLSEQDLLYLQLRQKYGNDVGLFSIYLLNLVHLKKGEAVFLKAGIPHAYLKGNIIECMANSDNVVRAGLTPKFKDIGTLVDILTYETGLPNIIQPDAGSHDIFYHVPTPEFALRQRILSTGQKRDVKNIEMEILLITDGQITLSGTDFDMTLKKGETVLIPAALSEYTITTDIAATIFAAFIPEK